MSRLTSLAEKGLIDNCLYCFRIFLFFFVIKNILKATKTQLVA